MMCGRSVITVDQLYRAGIGDDLGPFRERQIGGHDRLGLFGAFGDDVNNNSALFRPTVDSPVFQLSQRTQVQNDTNLPKA